MGGPVSPSRGAAFLEVSPSYYNLKHDAINFDSILRFDAQKRRVFAELSGPVEHGARLRWDLSTTLRNENLASAIGNSTNISTVSALPR
jgi:hypothetical protein